MRFVPHASAVYVALCLLALRCLFPQYVQLLLYPALPRRVLRITANASAHQRQTTLANASAMCCVALAVRRLEPNVSVALNHTTSAMYAALWPEVQAFLVLNDQETAPEGVRRLPPPEYDAHGTPRLHSLMARVRDACPDAPLLGYAKADVLFDRQPFLQTLKALAEWKRPLTLATGMRRVASPPQDYLFMARDMVDALPPHDADWDAGCAVDLSATVQANRSDAGSVAPFRSVLVNGEVRIVERSERMALTRGGQAVDEGALPSPLLVVFGNAAYRPLLGSFLCNAARFPGMRAHTLLIAIDQETAAYVGALAPEAFVWLHPEPQGSAMEYSTPEYVRLMLLRGQLLLRLLGPQRVVVWTEADFEYRRNPLEHPQLSLDYNASDVVLMWDGGNYCGCLIRFAATEASRAFYEEGVVRPLEAGIARGDFTDDQVLLNRALATTRASYAEFDRCAFRHGGAHLQPCAETRAWVQHHNWIVGNARKIERARERGAWFLSDDDPTRCATLDLRVVVMTMDRPRALERLLRSLRDARYPKAMRVDLRVNVDRRSTDAPHDAPTLALLDAFEWTRGAFEAHAWPAPMGLYGQWLEAWPAEVFPSELYRAVVLLEDDLEVSPVYHQWFLDAHAAYGAREDIGAITGMRAALVATPHGRSANELVPQDAGAFAYWLVATWSLSPTHAAWRRFRAWAQALDRRATDPGLLDTVARQWFRNFRSRGTEEDSMWEIWYMRFMHDQGLYTVYPWREDGAAYVCNWREPGLHYSDANVSPDAPLAQAIASIPTEERLLYADWGLALHLCAASASPALEADALRRRKRALVVDRLDDPRCAS